MFIVFSEWLHTTLDSFLTYPPGQQHYEFYSGRTINSDGQLTEAAFTHLKNEMTSDRVLVPYDPNLQF